MKLKQPRWLRVLSAMLFNYGQVVGNNYGSGNGPALISQPKRAKSPKARRRHKRAK